MSKSIVVSKSEIRRRVKEALLDHCVPSMRSGHYVSEQGELLTNADTIHQKFLINDAELRALGTQVVRSELAKRREQAQSQAERSQATPVAASAGYTSFSDLPAFGESLKTKDLVDEVIASLPKLLKSIASDFASSNKRRLQLRREKEINDEKTRMFMQLHEKQKAEADHRFVDSLTNLRVDVVDLVDSAEEDLITTISGVWLNSPDAIELKQSILGARDFSLLRDLYLALEQKKHYFPRAGETPPVWYRLSQSAYLNYHTERQFVGVAKRFLAVCELPARVDVILQARSLNKRVQLVHELQMHLSQHGRQITADSPRFSALFSKISALVSCLLQWMKSACSHLTTLKESSLNRREHRPTQIRERTLVGVGAPVDDESDRGSICSEDRFPRIPSVPRRFTIQRISFPNDDIEDAARDRAHSAPIPPVTRNDLADAQDARSAHVLISSGRVNTAALFRTVRRDLKVSASSLKLCARLAAGS